MILKRRNRFGVEGVVVKLSRTWKVVALSTSTVMLADYHEARSSHDSPLHVTPLTAVLVTVSVK